MNNRVKYWLDLCDDDVSTAQVLLNGKKFLPTAFYCHLAAEKALKAVIADVSSALPPKIHDLARLAKQGDIFNELTERQQEFLKELNPFHIEARYPEYKNRIAKRLTAEATLQLLQGTEALVCWIKQRLSK